MKRYEQLADEIAESIRLGVLRQGDQLPSIRQTRLTKHVSASTVFEAYYLLEARGLITAKERSGYYVTGGARLISQLPVPNMLAPIESSPVAVSELVFSILGAAKSRQVVPFGSAFPSPLLFPLNKLARHLSSSVNKMDPWTTVNDISPGDPELRRQIALRYMMDGLQLSINDIVITNGALEALNLCLAAVTQPGDKVIVESPTFYAALQAIERHHLQPIEVPNHPMIGMDLQALENVIVQHRPKACWLMTNFQNPTGSLMPASQKQQLVELLTRYEVPLIEDDVYGELYFGQQKPIPAKAYDHAGWVMHCGSFSKSLAPGYRVGWVSPGRFTQAVERIKLTASLATCVPAQIALADYLAKGGYDKHLRGLRHGLMMQQLKYSDAIAHYFPSGTRMSKPDGGYFFWIKLPNQVDALMLHRLALAENISIAPGPMFSSHQGYTDYIRLNYGHPWGAHIDRALKRLGTLISELLTQSESPI